MFDAIRSNPVFTPVLIAALTAIAFFYGCDDSVADNGSSSAGAGGASGSAGIPGGTSGSDSEASKVGTFDVKLNPEIVSPDPSLARDASTSVIAWIKDGPEPALTIWEKTGEEGECILLEPRIPFCDPSCGADVCVEDGQCAPRPTAQDVGTVTVHGLQTADGTNQVTLVPGPKGYQSIDTLTYPAFAEGDEIRLETSGGDFEPFTIQSRGIVPLELTTDAEIPMEREQPVLLSWNPPGNPDIARIHVMVDISHHGGAKGKIECDVADTGSLTIPATLVTGLLDLGYSGFPKVVVKRIATGSIEMALGRVELNVQSLVEGRITIPGLTSCTPDLDCPEGQTCQDCPEGQTCQWDFRCL